MNKTQIRVFDEKKFLSTYKDKKISGPAFVKYIKSIHERGGPNPKEYETINEVLNFYIANLPKEQILKIHKRMSKIFGDAYVHSTAGHASVKPRGYPGDFELMDKFYLYEHSKLKEFVKWDRFYHWHAAAKCIINRKKYFKREVKEKLKKKKKGQLHVMNIACGPGRDVFELFEEEGADRLHFEFVDADLNAILHATKLNYEYLSSITFHNKNIFKFETDKKVDFIWSGGLFDYFDDKTFVAMIAKIQDFLKPGGEMVIGNFSPRNPSRGYMELILGWYLYHRTEQDLIDLAKKACGDRIKKVRVGAEPEGTNLFVHITLK